MKRLECVLAVLSLLVLASCGGRTGGSSSHKGGGDGQPDTGAPTEEAAPAKTRSFPTVSVPRFPSLITRASSMGISTSPMTSTIMHSGPRINQVLYGLMYFIQCLKKALSLCVQKALHIKKRTAYRQFCGDAVRFRCVLRRFRKRWRCGELPQDRVFQQQKLPFRFTGPFSQVNKTHRIARHCGQHDVKH